MLTSNAEFICSDILKFCQKNDSCYDVAFALDFQNMFMIKTG